jgi:hypothetical protein
VPGGAHETHAPDDEQHCHRVVPRTVLLCEHCDSERIEPFAGSAMLS